jgi:PAS domain S-box-containing protein
MRVPESYNSLLVAVSIWISFFASYVALTLLNRLPPRWGTLGRAWLFAGAVMLGAGIWTMHFIGMLSLNLDTPVQYDYSLTFLSLLWGVSLAYIALTVLSSRHKSHRRLAFASALIGLTICTIHYSAMAAMRMPLRVEHHIPLTLLSLLVAAGASYVSLRITFRRNQPHAMPGALLLGGAISGTHYTAMAATTFVKTEAGAVNPGHYHGLDHHVLALFVGTSACMIIAALSALLLISIRNEAYKAKLREQQYKSLYEQHHQAVYTLDLNGSCMGLNQAFEDFTGYTALEMQNRAITALAAPGDLNSLIAQVQRAAGGVSQTGEIAWLHKQGHIVHSVSTHIPIHLGGRVMGIYGFIHDVTGLNHALKERDTMAKELRKSNDRLVRMQQIVGHGIWDNDLRTGTLHWSHETYRILGLDPAITPSPELFFRMLHPEDRDKVKEAMEQAKQGLPYRCEFRIVRDKEIRSLISQGEALIDDCGRPYRMWGVVMDVTERKQTEAILRKSDRLSIVSQMAAGVAHEIRNPLTSIKGFVQLMKPKFNEHHYRLMMSEMDRIEQIIREFLLIAKPSRQESFEAGCLTTILDHVLSLLSTQTAMNKVWIACDIDKGLPDVWCNENQLKQVFINIIQNAIEAMPDGGEILICAGISSSSSTILISVQDQGIGIPAERIKRLGEPYFTSKEKGTGLGLTICHRIIETHGGSMSIQSEPGKGTLVEIHLPVDQAAKKASGG